jgi:hypothetical protein
MRLVLRSVRIINANVDAEAVVENKNPDAWVEEYALELCEMARERLLRARI